MRYISILMTIIIYWVLLGIMVNAVMSDPVITESLDGNAFNSSYGYSDVNLSSSIDAPYTENLSKWKSTISFLFGFKTPIPAGIPQGFTVLISFINWFLALLLAICIYKIGNPLSSA